MQSVSSVAGWQLAGSSGTISSTVEEEHDIAPPVASTTSAVDAHESKTTAAATAMVRAGPRAAAPDRDNPLEQSECGQGEGGKARTDIGRSVVLTD